MKEVGLRARDGGVADPARVERAKAGVAHRRGYDWAGLLTEPKLY